MPTEAVEPSGRINGAVNINGEKHNKEYALHLDQLGEQHKNLSSFEMEKITGSTFYKSGLFLPAVLCFNRLFI